MKNHYGGVCAEGTDFYFVQNDRGKFYLPLYQWYFVEINQDKNRGRTLAAPTELYKIPKQKFYPSCVPQLVQNLALGRFCVWQLEQVLPAWSVPHSGQNFELAGIWALQL